MLCTTPWQSFFSYISCLILSAREVQIRQGTQTLRKYLCHWSHWEIWCLWSRDSAEELHALHKQQLLNPVQKDNKQAWFSGERPATDVSISNKIKLQRHEGEKETAKKMTPKPQKEGPRFYLQQMQVGKWELQPDWICQPRAAPFSCCGRADAAESLLTMQRAPPASVHTVCPHPRHLLGDR